MSQMNGPPLSVDLVDPRNLSAAQIERWHAIMSANAVWQNAFLSPEFVRACAQSHGRVNVAIVTCDDEIVGFMPFQFSSAFGQRIGLATVTGEQMADRSALLVADTDVIDFRRILSQTGIGTVYLHHVSENDPYLGNLIVQREPSHAIDLQHGAGRYLEGLTASKKKLVGDTERRMRKLEQDVGPIEFRFDMAPDALAIERLMDNKQAQYIRRDATPVFGSRARRDLLVELSQSRSAFCQPLLTTLLAAGRPIAQHFGIMCGDTLHYWFPVYDHAMRKFAPGRLLLWKTIENASELGIRCIDRGAGDSQSKRDFSNSESSIGKFLWIGDTLKAKAARLVLSLQWRLAKYRKN